MRSRKIDPPTSPRTITPGSPKRRHSFAWMARKRFILVGFNALVIFSVWIYKHSSIDDYYPSNAGNSLRFSPVETTSCKAPADVTTFTTSVAEYNDPDLHKTATVMGMATGYDVGVYKRFVGSLRKTGFEGNIILVVKPTIDKTSEDYLQAKNVTMHKVKYVNCTHTFGILEEDKNKDTHTKEFSTCVHPYPGLKNRWGRFPILRDLLQDCGGRPDPERQCGGPVLVADVRDTVFQRNPFGPEAPLVYGLQVFEEHYTMKTTNWLVDWPIGDCKGVHYDKPMLCSGTTIGTRQAILDYLNTMHEEMKLWMADPKCHFKINGDDQSIHNYLYYAGKLDGVSGGVLAAKNRNALVHTIGNLANLILSTHREVHDVKGNPPYDLSPNEDKKNTQNWLGLQYGLTDSDGYVVEYDGTRSFVLHQIDRFGPQFDRWVKMHLSDE